MRRSTKAVDNLPHDLIPLALAVGVVRSKVYDGRSLTNQGAEGELNMLAAVIAATVTVYEYPADRSAGVRALPRRALEGGLFRNGGREMRFIDGRAAKRDLAVNATDISFVVSLLRDPDHGAQIRSRFTRKRAREIKAQSEKLIGQATELRRVSADFRRENSKPGLAMPDPSAGGRRAPAG